MRLAPAHDPAWNFIGGRRSTMARLVISLVLFLAIAGTAFAQTPSTQPPATTPPPVTAPPTPAPATTAPPSTHFTTQAAAKSHCPDDTIVWATLSRARVFHVSGDRYYGKTRHGAYMCQTDAIKAGMHQAGHRRTTSASGTGSTSGTSH
jgi:hypothetical protein